MDDLLFPEASQVLEEAIARHRGVFAYAFEAIDLAHIAFHRERDISARFLPGTPSIRRVRNDINDDAWRFLKLIGEPLISGGLIRSFADVDGGDVMILPDGMHVRMKKGDASGNTSNYPTSKIRRVAIVSNMALFSGASPLDVAIQEGVIFDLVFVAGKVMGEYIQIGLRYAVAEASPFILMDQPSQQQLRQISPTGYGFVSEARAKLAS